MMKMLIAIINDDDCTRVLTELSNQGFGATRLSTSGGFLRSGNSTLLIGVEEENIEKIFDIFRRFSSRRKQMISPMGGMDGLDMFTPPVEISVGGATVFVIDVDKFVKL